MNNKTKTLCASGLVALLLSGCGGGGDGSTSSTGTLNLGVTDAPIDEAYAVVVKFVAVELKPKEGPSFTIDMEDEDGNPTPKTINLLELQGSEFDFLVKNEEVPAGEYNWMRLVLDADENELDSYIELTNGGMQYPLYVPSGDQTGLKVNKAFTVPAGGVVNLTIDFDVRKSIVAPSKPDGDYKLKPVLRLEQEVGHIAGTVPSQVYIDDTECAGAVYAFAGEDVTPTDEGPSDPNPVTSALVSMDTDTGDYVYELGFLAPGAYTVAFTCEADDDVLESDDAISFGLTESANVSVVKDDTTIHNFTLVP